MKQFDFLPNLILIVLSGIMMACLGHLAAGRAIPVTYTSCTEVQLAGHDVHSGDVNDLAVLVSEDEIILSNLVNELDLRDAARKPVSTDTLSGWLTISTRPEEGVVSVSVRTEDPYLSRDIAYGVVSIAGPAFEESHAGISVNIVEAAYAANGAASPLGVYTWISGIIGLLGGTALVVAILKRGRTSRRTRKRGPAKDTGDSMKASEDENLFADDNEDVDPEMRELYRIAREAEAQRGGPVPGEEQAEEEQPEKEQPEEEQPEEEQPEEVQSEEPQYRESTPEGEQPEEEIPDEMQGEQPMSAEAEAAYLEAMEIEAMAVDSEDVLSNQPDIGAGEEGGNCDEV